MTVARNKRYYISSDESGHEYFVLVGEQTQFDKWVASTEDNALDYDGPDYEGNRIDGRFTFTDPKCE